MQNVNISMKDPSNEFLGPTQPIPGTGQLQERFRSVRRNRRNIRVAPEARQMTKMGSQTSIMGG